MGAKRFADGVVGDDRGVLVGAGDRGRHQPPLHLEQLRGGPAALLQGSVGDDGHCPLRQEPVGQLLEFGLGGAGEAGAEGDQDVVAGEGGRLGGQPLRRGELVEQLTDRPLGQGRLLLAATAGHLADQAVRVDAAVGRSVRHRWYSVSGAWWSLGLRVAWTTH